MAELYGHAGVVAPEARLQFCRQPCIKFYVPNVVSRFEWFGASVERHVNQSESHLSQAAHSNVEVAASSHSSNKFLRHGFACLIVEGEGLQEVFFYGIVFHEL